MKPNLVLACIILAFIACSKNPITPTEEDNKGKYLLSFQVDGFSQELLPFANKIKEKNISASAVLNSRGSSVTALSATNSAIDLRDYINTLEIKVYNGKTLVDSIRQYADNPDFGKFSKYYMQSTLLYNVYIVGAKLENDGDLIMKKVPSASVELVQLEILPGPTDAFTTFKSFDSMLEQNHESINLKRFVGRLEINLNEQIPADAARVEVTIENTAKYFMPFYQRGYHVNMYDPKDTNYDDSTPYHTTKNTLIKAEDIGSESYSIAAYFVLKGLVDSAPQATTVILSAYRSDGTLIQRKEVPNVSVQANKRTRLVGQLFTAPNIDFQVGLESEWDLDVPEYSF